MTLEEYKKKQLDLKADYELACRRLREEYALSNNPYKIGDIIEDHIGKGRIRKVAAIYIAFTDIMPTLVYECDNLTKKGEIQKREPIRRIFQCNIRK